MNTTAYTLRTYFNAAKRYWATGLLTVFMVIVAVVSVDILTPFVASRIFALLPEIAGGTSPDQAFGYWGWLVALGILTFLAWRSVGFLMLTRQPKILQDISQRVFDHLTTQSYGFFTNRFSGALVAQTGRFIRGYEVVEDVFFFQLLPGMVRLVATTGVLLVVLPPVGVALLAWSVLFIASVIWLTRKKQPITRRAADADSTVTARQADVMTNALNWIVFGRRGAERKSYGEVVGKQQRLRQRSWFYDELIIAYQVFIMIAFELAFAWIAITLVASHQVGLATILLAQFYIARIISDLWSVQGITKHLGRVFGDTAEMAKILNVRPEIRDAKRPKPLYVAGGGVRFEDVTFAYRGHPPVYRNFSLTIKPGERVGLVGPSGGGKSTLIKLLLRFADVRSGRILIDEQPIRSVPQEELRRNLAYVPQEPILFHRSLEENIRYSRPDASKDEVREAARLAQAAGFIEALPKGYRTLVGERGVKLSGGERQRVAIARAILSQAPILLLDEATSSLDSESEKLISAAMKQLMQDRTTLVIAHRLSTIRSLDRILVMEHGRIAEAGTHRELLERDGAYAGLWKHQSGGFIGEE